MNLASQVMNALDALRAEYPTMPEDEAALRRLLQLAWLDGNKAGLATGKSIAEAGFANLRRRLDSAAP